MGALSSSGLLEHYRLLGHPHPALPRKREREKKATCLSSGFAWRWYEREGFV